MESSLPFPVGLTLGAGFAVGIGHLVNLLSRRTLFGR